MTNLMGLIIINPYRVHVHIASDIFLKTHLLVFIFLYQVLILIYRNAAISAPCGYMKTEKINTVQNIYFSVFSVFKGIYYFGTSYSPMGH